MPEPPFDLTGVTLDLASGRARLEVTGDVDLESVGHLDRALDRLAVDGIEQFTVDLAKVTFMDSTGVGTLIRFQKQHPKAQLTLVNASPAVRELFRITGIDHYLVVR